MIQRRSFLMLSAGSLLCSSAVLLSRAMAQPFTLSPAMVLQNLETSVWLSTNRGAEKTAYVIAAPWCGYTQRFYQEQLQVDHGVDFRFVYYSLNQYDKAIARAYLSDGVDQVGVFYADPGVRLPYEYQTPAKWIESINFTAIQKMSASVRELNPSRGKGSASASGLTVPTIVQRDAAGHLVVVSDATGKVELLAESNHFESAYRQPSANYRRLLKTERLPRSATKNYYAKAERADCYAAPVQGAPLVDQIPKGYGLDGSAEVIDGEEWVALKAFQKHDYRIWSRAHNFVTG